MLIIGTFDPINLQNVFSNYVLFKDFLSITSKLPSFDDNYFIKRLNGGIYVL